MIQAGKIKAHFNTRLREIRPGNVLLEDCSDDSQACRQEFPADFVLLMTGFKANNELLEGAGVTLQGDGKVPVFNPETQETDVPGLYVAGTATAGSQGEYRVFIETSHIHVTKIMAHLTGQSPPDTPRLNARPES